MDVPVQHRLQHMNQQDTQQDLHARCLSLQAPALAGDAVHAVVDMLAMTSGRPRMGMPVVGPCNLRSMSDLNEEQGAGQC